MDVLNSPISNIPSLPQRSSARSHSPSPFKVLYLTNRKLDRELASATPNLYRLVLCANTYDKTLQYQASIAKVNSARAIALKTKQKHSRDKHNAKSSTPATSLEQRHDSTNTFTSASASTVQVLEVPEELEDSDQDLFDLTKTNDAEPISTVTEDLFEDWDGESDVSSVDSSESEGSSEDESGGESDEG